ncbi:hypothetical protein H2200_008931 [Cladophialophora chaetospira]|uniref:Uncharacterized protein n=1 Tax=Cladophialophora chaetospira TaxID=386627 RepID=A0AA38X5E3_9EURO|nr:hypothetical protein H2200_008931 [Cladophialophora chaetospira]
MALPEDAQALLGKEIDSNDPGLPDRHITCSRSTYSTAACIVVAAIAGSIAAVIVVVFIVSLTYALRWQPAHPEAFCVSDCYCGTTVQEARSLHCVYDEVAAAFLPPHCIDIELSTEFKNAGNGPNGTWNYYGSPDSLQTITPTEAAELAGTHQLVWVTRQWHIMHCAYYWQKERKARAGKVCLETRFASEGHVSHCLRLMSWMEIPLNQIVTHFGVVLNSSLEENEKADMRPAAVLREGKMAEAFGVADS